MYRHIYMAVCVLIVAKTYDLGFQCAASAPTSAHPCVATVRPLKRRHSAPLSAHLQCAPCPRSEGGASR